MSAPLAYFITFRCYGTWLHGDDRGSVDPEHNRFDTPLLPPDSQTCEDEERRRAQPAYSLDETRRTIVLTAIREVAVYRKWALLAAHVRSNHVHVVVSTEGTPERALNDFKSYASRALNRAGSDGPDRLRWSRHGSTRYLWKAIDVRDAMDYVVRRQGEPMAVYEADEEAKGAVIETGD